MPSRSNKPPSLTLTVCTLLTLSAISPLPTPVFATPLFDRSPSLHDIEWASTAKMGQNPVIGLGLGLDLDHEFDPDARGATDEEIVTVMDGVLPEYPTSWHKESPRVTSQQTDSPSIVIGHEPVASDVWEDRPAESDEQDIAGQAISRFLSSLFSSLKLWGLTKRDSPSSESSTLPTIPTSAIAMSAPFPSPLDSSLSYSLRNSCVAFLTSVMTSEKMGGSGQGAATTVSKGSTGKGSCKPAGLLMATSSGWASLLRQPSEMNAALSQICHPSDVDVSQDCSAYFSQMGKDMVKQENCYDDLNEGNAVALQAYDGLIHYDMMQQAACLPDDSTGTYCYLEAMTASTPDDGYLWTLPGGNSLPSTTKPSCSSCSKSLLTLFSNTVANTTSSVKTKFGPSFSTALGNATNLVDNACGNGFVNVEALGSTSGASRSSTITISGLGVGLAVLAVALSCI